MRRQSYFVSDLHLFCNRFDGERHWDAIRQAASEAHTFVLGGDVFDFRWTTMSSIEEAADEAIRRLQGLVNITRRLC